jgi:hypothetical protein
MKNNNITWEEFEKTCYHTQYNIVIPLVDRMRINKLEFMTKGKLDNDKLRSKLMGIYEEKFKK